MGFVFSGLFWGLLIILIGVSIIINVTFNIKLPLFRIIAALIFIFIGLSILFKGFGPNKSNDVIFNKSELAYQSDNKEYNVIFGKGNIDLSSLKEVPENTTLEINCIFGEGDVILNTDIPVKLKIDSAFASAQAPDGNSITFGNYTYKTESFDTNKPYLKIKANVVFGALNFRAASAPPKQDS